MRCVLCGRARVLERLLARAAALELGERHVNEPADLLVAIADLVGHPEAALEHVERAAGVAAREVDLADRDEDVGHARAVLALLADLERLGQVALAAIEVAEVGVALAVVAELERDGRAV